MQMAIVPAFNESKRIAGVVEALMSVVDRVVVVDDASVDNTAAIASAAGAIVLVHEVNRGQGAALETGHAYARKHNANLVIHFDGDDQFTVDDIPPAIAHLQKSGADILIGSRFLGATSNIPWFKKTVLLRLGRVVDWLFGGVHLSDAHNGFRILTPKALSHIVIEQDRMAHATEIPQLIKRHNLSYTEFPVHVTYHEYGQGMGDGIHIVKDIILGRFV